VHVIGKGITRFHALIWPAILGSAGLAWPTDLLVHGYLTQAGAKISKSGVALDPQPLIAELGADALRYFLLRHVRTTRDGDFSHERWVKAYNAELANDLGNLANRVFGLVQRASGGVVPVPAAAEPAARELEQLAAALPAAIDGALERFAIDEALDAVFALIGACNRFLDRTAPWAALKRGDTARASAQLRALLEVLRIVAGELEPFLPETAARLTQALGVDGPPGHGFYQLREQHQLPRNLQLFPRYDSAPLQAAPTPTRTSD
jgi:methionyl-tRNA synthetase